MYGEEIGAVVVPDRASEVDAKELISWPRDRLARHKYPRHIGFVEALPLGASHKVLKRERRGMLSGQAP